MDKIDIVTEEQDANSKDINVREKDLDIELALEVVETSYSFGEPRY